MPLCSLPRLTDSGMGPDFTPAPCPLGSQSLPDFTRSSDLVLCLDRDLAGMPPDFLAQALAEIVDRVDSAGDVLCDGEREFRIFVRPPRLLDNLHCDLELVLLGGLLFGEFMVSSPSWLMGFRKGEARVPETLPIGEIGVELSSLAGRLFCPARRPEAGENSWPDTAGLGLMARGARPLDGLNRFVSRSRPSPRDRDAQGGASRSLATRPRSSPTASAESPVSSPCEAHAASTFV